MRALAGHSAACGEAGLNHLSQVFSPDSGRRASLGSTAKSHYLFQRLTNREVQRMSLVRLSNDREDITLILEMLEQQTVTHGERARGSGTAQLDDVPPHREVGRVSIATGVDHAADQCGTIHPQRHFLIEVGAEEGVVRRSLGHQERGPARTVAERPLEIVVKEAHPTGDGPPLDGDSRMRKVDIVRGVRRPVGSRGHGGEQTQEKDTSPRFRESGTHGSLRRRSIDEPMDLAIVCTLAPDARAAYPSSRPWISSLHSSDESHRVGRGDTMPRDVAWAARRAAPTDGYVAEPPGRPDAAARRAEVFETEQVDCTFLARHFVAAPNDGSVRLAISGPAGTSEFRHNLRRLA